MMKQLSPYWDIYIQYKLTKYPEKGGLLLSRMVYEGRHVYNGKFGPVQGY